jgi:AcrR family transcriptional regulator
LSVEERRTHLIVAAIGLAERKGVSGVTTRDVAKAAGVSLGVVHYCFENKDALMMELVKALSTAMRDCIDTDTDTGVWQHSETGPVTLRAVVSAALSMLWLNVEATRRRQLLAYEAVTYVLRESEPEQGNSTTSSIAVDQYVATDATIGEVLAKAARIAQTRWTTPLPTLSRLVVTMVDGIVLRWLVDDDSVAARGQLDLLTDLLLTHAAD